MRGLELEGAEEAGVEVRPAVEPDELGRDTEGFEVDDSASTLSAEGDGDVMEVDGEDPHVFAAGVRAEVHGEPTDGGSADAADVGI